MDIYDRMDPQLAAVHRQMPKAMFADISEIRAGLGRWSRLAVCSRVLL
jgi:hypothetical protein